MVRDSLANRLAIKRKAGFLKTFNKRIDTLKREKERLEKALEDRDSLGNQPWLDRVQRTVQGFVGAGPVYGIIPVSDWAKQSLDHIKKIKQNSAAPTEEDINWITSMTQELAVLQSEAMAEIQDDVSPEELTDPPNRISSLPLGFFPSAQRPIASLLEPKTEETPEEPTAPPADEIEKPDNQGTLPPEPVEASSSENEDGPRETAETSAETTLKSEALPPYRQSDLGESAPAREPSIPPPTASVGGYTPPWETVPFKSDIPGTGAKEPVDVEAMRSRNVENTIPLTIDDLTAVSHDRDRDKPPPPLAFDGEPGGKVPLGWKLLTAGLCVALLISLYFNWRSYAKGTDRPISNKESVLDTGEIGTSPAADKPTASANGDNTTSPEGKDTPRTNVQESTGKEEPSASVDAPKKTKKRKSSSRSRSRSRRTRAKKSTDNSPSEPANNRSSKRSDPRPSGTTGVLSILVPSHARGPVSITVDKRPKGKAPLKLSLTPGLHEVVQTYKGNRTMRIVLIQKGKTKVITAKVPK
jgi:hypothetical protein